MNAIAVTEPSTDGPIDDEARWRIALAKDRRYGSTSVTLYEQEESPS